MTAEPQGQCDSSLHRRWLAEQRLIEAEESQQRSLLVRRVVWCVVVIVLVVWIAIAATVLLAVL